MEPENIQTLALEIAKNMPMGTSWPRWLSLKLAAKYSNYGEKKLIELAQTTPPKIRGFRDPELGKNPWVFDKDSIDLYRLEQSTLADRSDEITERKNKKLKQGNPRRSMKRIDDKNKTDIKPLDGSAKLHKLIKEYTKCAIADSWKGGGHPEEIPDIEADLKKSKEKLDAYIKQLFTTMNTCTTGSTTAFKEGA